MPSQAVLSGEHTLTCSGVTVRDIRSKSESERDLLIFVIRKSGAGFHSLTLAPEVSFESGQKNHCVQSPGFET